MSIHRIAIVAGAVMSASAVASASITNPDFEFGNSGFDSSYTYTAVDCWPETTYSVVTSPSAVHGLWYSFGDHTTGSGNMMVVNGNTSGNVTVWEQTVSVIPGMQYEFAGWFANVYHQAPSSLSLMADGVSILDFTVDPDVGEWNRFAGFFNAGAATSIVLSIVDSNFEHTGNDFAIDDLSLAQVPAPGAVALAGLGMMMNIRRRRTV